MCLDTNVHPPGGRQSHKNPVDVSRGGMDNCTKPDKPPDFTMETLWDSLPMCGCIWSAKQLMASNPRFTRECHDSHGTVHMELQEWTVDTSGGINHKESVNTTQVKEPMLEGNHFYTKHYKISSGNTKGDGTHTPGVLPLEVVDTEVGDCNTHFADRVKFINKSEDTQTSRYLGLEDNALSKHVGFKVRIPDWIESHSQLDTSIPSSTDNGDDNLSKILTVVSTNNPEVQNVKADSDLNAWRLIKLQRDRIGFIKGNSCN